VLSWRSFVVVAWVLMALAFAGCGDDDGEPADTPAGSTATSPGGGVTVARLMEVGDQVFPYSAQGAVYGVCGASGDLTPCPYTERLKARLMEARATLCRCQNASQTRVMSAEVTNFGGVIHVALFNGSVNFDLRVLDQNGRLLVEDQTCMGRGPESSIYQTLGLC
jgi:hypothetical protein